MLIECSSCESKVQVKEVASLSISMEYVDVPSKYSFLKCEVCGTAMVGFAEVHQVGPSDYEYGNFTREWPNPDNDLAYDIPDIARISLLEAQVCFKAKAYSATAVMCGRALEGVCKHHNPKIKTLASGLKKLKEQNVIDSRLYEWSEELRKARNLGAHASTVKVSRQDARDLLDFSTVICEYVFVLNEKFERFKERSKKT